MTISSVKYLLQAMCVALSYGILIIFINTKPQKYHSFDANEIVYLCLTLATIKLVVLLCTMSNTVMSNNDMDSNVLPTQVPLVPTPE